MIMESKEERDGVMGLYDRLKKKEESGEQGPCRELF